VGRRRVRAVTGSERLVVDAVLGTGARPPARDHALAYARHLADEGARVARAMPRLAAWWWRSTCRAGSTRLRATRSGSPCAPT
jgi:NAD(P)H-hydrate repair Nnr-like enzyme with NAD(P)H-hydrate epimerase domain